MATIICKIKKDYLEKIEDGTKQVEFRQFGKGDTIVLVDDSSESVNIYEIDSVQTTTEKQAENIKRTHNDIEWDTNKEIFAINLGKKINTEKDFSITILWKDVERISKHPQYCFSVQKLQKRL
ncbi:MAG: hypothetical protein BWK75_01985 [Candidatus Altiarchaeales archaeon A3]|nr:MAG: hypothetical protein BWK75_01985 [Candidatus Altiarchaeales archaeon A3]